MGYLLSDIKGKITKEEDITYDEAKVLLSIDLDDLFNIAEDIRKQFFKNKVELCGIINAKSGLCSENCRYCAQSVHYNTNVDNYPLLDKDTILEKAKKTEETGVKCFSIVTSGNSLSSDEFKNVYDVFKVLRRETDLVLAASLGSISYIQAFTLRQIGVTRYHHNIETSKSFYPKICSTHTYEDRIKTIRNVKCAGFEVCSGGIIGMGESELERLEMAIELKNLKVNSIPINILNPIKGTPLENVKKLSSEEILKTISIFRIINPKAYIRLAAGRSQLNDKQEASFKAGINGIMIGNFLTTLGNDILEDKKMLNELGYVFK
ncbi:MAG: biotin synthase BioB [Clostridiales bacterium]